jgi:hypothetical protein
VVPGKEDEDMEELRVKIDGKYTVVWDTAGLRALRYGLPWRDLVGDKLVLAMAFEIDELRKRVDHGRTSTI